MFLSQVKQVLLDVIVVLRMAVVLIVGLVGVCHFAGVHLSMGDPLLIAVILMIPACKLWQTFAVAAAGIGLILLVLVAGSDWWIHAAMLVFLTGLALWFAAVCIAWMPLYPARLSES